MVTGSCPREHHTTFSEADRGEIDPNTVYGWIPENNTEKIFLPSGKLEWRSPVSGSKTSDRQE